MTKATKGNSQHGDLKFYLIVDNIDIYFTCKKICDRSSTPGVINFDIRINVVKCSCFYNYIVEHYDLWKFGAPLLNNYA